MNDIGSALGAYSTAFTVAGFLAAVFAFFLYSLRKQQLELLRQDRDDANERAEGFREDLEQFKIRANAEKKELQDRNFAQETLLTTQGQEIHVLRSVVTGKDQLDRIEKVLTDFTERFFSDGNST